MTPEAARRPLVRHGSKPGLVPCGVVLCAACNQGLLADYCVRCGGRGYDIEESVRLLAVWFCDERGGRVIDENDLSAAEYYARIVASMNKGGAL